ncbi:MAG: TnsA endonuclease N-terminal domain-containing protein [Pseudomonadota bacterium]|nr:TnsA endonuclease N-terminal domain-containing protein [Pseudomonadota bacterium]
MLGDCPLPGLACFLLRCHRLWPELLARDAARVPVVVSTDLLLTRRDSGASVLLARAVKDNAAIDLAAARTRRQAVNIRRTLQKLEIERRYWVEKDIHWMLLTEQHLSKTRKTNIEFILGVDLDPDRPAGYWRRAVVAVHDAVVAGKERTLDQIARRLDADGVLPRRDFPVCMRWLCAKRVMSFDMGRKFELSRPACDFMSAGPCEGEDV